MSALSRLRYPSGWPLRTQLVVGVCLLVTAVLAGIGAVSAWFLRTSATDIIDAQLLASSNAFCHPVDNYLAGQVSRSSAPPEEMKPLTEFLGQAPGSVIVFMRDGQVVDSAMFSNAGAVTASAELVSSIEAQPWQSRPGQAETTYLDGAGKYRMLASPRDDGVMLIAGVPFAPAQKAVNAATTFFIALIVLAVLVTAVFTALIVRGALRPLARVTATAAKVATLPLGREHRSIDVRVADADPRTEVGLVGDTLNRLLHHVDRALNDLAASDRRMRRFITDASHELRTPLAAIAGYAELTRQDSEILPENTEYSLSRIESEAARMTALVGDLLLLARLDEGQDLDLEEVDLTEIVRDATSDAEVSAPHHRWLVSVPETAVWVHADRARLHQLLANLQRNAWVHTPPGTTVFTAVNIVEHDHRRVVELAVADDGPGIDAEFVPMLFERFARGDRSRSRQHGSSGLGLAIVASIVDAHDGTVDVESRRGATVFRVRLPLVERIEHRDTLVGAITGA